MSRLGDKLRRLADNVDAIPVKAVSGGYLRGCGLILVDDDIEYFLGVDGEQSLDDGGYDLASKLGFALSQAAFVAANDQRRDA